MGGEQVLLLAHIPLDSGGFFTTNYLFAAIEGARTGVNVKCFNDAGQRIGPKDGVDLDLEQFGNVAQPHTPTTLQVSTDPLFSSGIGWCWAHSQLFGRPFNVQITIGATTNLSPRGILDSTTSTLVGTNTGLDQLLLSHRGLTSKGGTPFHVANGQTLNFLVLVNPTRRAITLTLQLFGSTPRTLRRVLNGRSLQALPIPGAFGGTGSFPTGGSVIISASEPGGGVLGWLVTAQPSTGRLQFTAVGLDTTEQLSAADAP